jgi:excisionase family DNA binding protein
MPMSLPAEVPLTTRDVALLLDVSPERVRQLAREGQLDAIRTAGGLRLYDRASIDKYLASRA